MNDNNMDNNQPLVGLAFQYDETDHLVNTCLQVDPTEQPVKLSRLCPADQKLRAECEADIQEGLVAVNNVGFRLHLIKTKKLYRSTHRLFSTYCEEVFGISRVHANRHIEAYYTDETLKSEPIGSVSVPGTESQGRTIANLTPKEKVKIAKKVKEKVGTDTATAKDWQQAREEVLPSRNTSKRSKVPANTRIRDDEHKMVPIPAETAQSGQILVQLPSEFFQADCDLPTLQRLSVMASLHNKIRNDPSKKQLADKLASELESALQMYGKWEQEFLIPAPEKEALAA